MSHLFQATHQYSQETQLQLHLEMDSFTLLQDDFELGLLDRIIRNSLLS